MTSARLRDILTALGWSQDDFRARLGLSERSSTVRQWCSGRGTIPDRVGDWLERVAAGVIAEPLPPDWSV